MANQYVAWLNTQTGAAFFNPISITGQNIGDTVNDHIAVAIGTQEQVQIVVDGLNAKLPALPSFDELANAAATPATKHQNNLRTLVCYLRGFADAEGESIVPTPCLPPFLYATVGECLEHYAATGAAAPAGLGDFDKGGKWHGAVCDLIFDLNKKAKAMTSATHEYPEGISQSDAMHKALMNTQRRNLGISLA